MLDEETRPIVCRLYPYSYNHAGLLGEDPDYCPTATLKPPGGSMVALLQMTRARAEVWRADLYRELRADAAKRAKS